MPTFSYKLQDLVDIPTLKILLEKLYHAASIPSAIIDMEGNVLTGAGWQRICLDYHRKNPESCQKCIDSDIHIRDSLKKGAPYVIYKCPHGLVDASSPVIIKGNHIANVFAGQLLTEPLTDEKIEQFKKRAKRYGFDEVEYIAALKEVPVLPLEKFKSILDFFSGFAKMIAETGLSNLENKKALSRFESVMNSLDALIYVADMKSYEILFINNYGKKFWGDITGEICWISLQKDQTGPCAFCTNDKLVDKSGKATGIYVWEFENTVNNEWYQCHDQAIHWDDRGLVRMEIANNITDQKLMEVRIKDDLKEKNLLLKEVHHRTKNNMSVISAMLNLKAMDENDDKITHLFLEMENRIKSMALVHEKLYRSTNLTHIDFEDYLEEISITLLQSYEHSNKINLTFETKPIFISIDQAVPCGIVVNELIMNCVKHAFKDRDQGNIHITLKELTANEVLIEIKDNGIGMPQDFDLERIDSFGIRMVILLVEKQLNGKLKFESNYGAIFQILFKLLS